MGNKKLCHLNIGLNLYLQCFRTLDLNIVDKDKVSTVIKNA